MWYTKPVTLHLHGALEWPGHAAFDWQLLFPYLG